MIGSPTGFVFATLKKSVSEEGNTTEGSAVDDRRGLQAFAKAAVAGGCRPPAAGSYCVLRSSKPKPPHDHFGHSSLGLSLGDNDQVGVRKRWSGSDELPPRLVREIKR
jgi:hypothetical protein